MTEIPPKPIKLPKHLLDVKDDRNISEPYKMTKIPLETWKLPKYPKNLKNDWNTPKTYKNE